MTESPPSFFAANDDDEERVNPSRTTSEPDAAPSSSPASDNPLFLPDDNSDTNESPLTRFKALRDETPSVLEYDTEMLEIFDIPTLKRPNAEASSSTKETSPEITRSSKRRKVSQSSQTPQLASKFKSAYFGTIVVGNAWSTVKGKGYVKNGDEIVVEWEGDKDESRGATIAKKNSKAEKGKGKQIYITAMLKPQAQPKRVKKKQNDIVRLTNKSGFGMASFCCMCGETQLILPRIR